MITISGFWVLMFIAALALVAGLVFLALIDSAWGTVSGVCLVLLSAILACSAVVTDHRDEQTWTDERPITSAVASADGEEAGGWGNTDDKRVYIFDDSSVFYINLEPGKGYMVTLNGRFQGCFYAVDNVGFAALADSGIVGSFELIVASPIKEVIGKYVLEDQDEA